MSIRKGRDKDIIQEVKGGSYRTKYELPRCYYVSRVPVIRTEMHCPVALLSRLGRSEVAVGLAGAIPPLSLNRVDADAPSNAILSKIHFPTSY